MIPWMVRIGAVPNEKRFASWAAATTVMPIRRTARDRKITPKWNITRVLGYPAEKREYITVGEAFLKYSYLGVVAAIPIPPGPLAIALIAASVNPGVALVVEALAVLVLYAVIFTILDPMDYYEGGLLSPEQGTIIRKHVEETKAKAAKEYSESTLIGLSGLYWLKMKIEQAFATAAIPV